MSFFADAVATLFAQAAAAFLYFLFSTFSTKAEATIWAFSCAQLLVYQTSG